MPGGYGTDEDTTPWGSSGVSYVVGGGSSIPYESGAGPTNEPVKPEVKTQAAGKAPILDWINYNNNIQLLRKIIQSLLKQKENNYPFIKEAKCSPI